MQGNDPRDIEAALSKVQSTVKMVRTAQSSADPQVLQQAQRQLDQAQAELEAVMEGEESDAAPTQEALQQLAQSRYNLSLSMSISNPVGYDLY